MDAGPIHSSFLTICKVGFILNFLILAEGLRWGISRYSIPRVSRATPASRIPDRVVSAAHCSKFMARSSTSVLLLSLSSTLSSSKSFNISGRNSIVVGLSAIIVRSLNTKSSQTIRDEGGGVKKAPGHWPAAFYLLLLLTKLPNFRIFFAINFKDSSAA